MSIAPRPEMLQCVKEDCAASVVLIPSLKNQPDQPIQFHMQFNTNQLGYAAVGITSGEKMDKMVILECVKEPGSGTIRSYLSWNEATKTSVQEIAPVRVYSNANSTLDTTQPTPSHGTEPPSLPPTPANITPPESESGVAYCDFYLPQKLTIKLPSQSFTVDLVSTAYAVSVAIGNVADGPDSCAGVKPDGNYPGTLICHHKAVKASTKFLLMEVQNKIASKSFLLQHLHAFFMVLSYFTLMPIATIVARFFRETWSTRQVFNKRLWFSIHAGLLYGAMFFTILGYACMAIATGEMWPGESGEQTHAFLGMTSIGLLSTQAILPWIVHIPGKHLNVKKVYSIIHAVVGSVCYMLGLLNIALAPYLMPDNVDCSVILITFVWIGCHFCIYWLLSTLLIIKDHQMPNNSTRFRALFSYPMRLKTMDDAPGKTKREVFLGILVVLSLVLTMAMGFIVLRDGGHCNRYNPNNNDTNH
ncbi:putative ferric-chelate reductase 1 homolog [Folsomia candida]|uniref:putative ferric-chelate reductase 1 homolog n=1 Tax=Folsomia candida TaxID=158441 RepID=UPI001604BCA6|nr:putative ferric-chelate reductase 1 homolog [Folsomia candida]